MKIGTLTIGQSPRLDIIQELQTILGARVKIIEKGALDGLTLEEVKKLYPQDHEEVLITRMRDGTEIKIAEKNIVERLRKCIADFQEEPVELIILLCTGEFPEIESKKVILRPDRIVSPVVRGILDRGKIGVLVPTPDQIPGTQKKWGKPHLDVVAEAFSPYTGDEEELKTKSYKLKEANIDLVILDCLGYGNGIKKIVRKITRKPVLLPRAMIAKVAKEMLAT
jgi:protein AroM